MEIPRFLGWLPVVEILSGESQDNIEEFDDLLIQIEKDYKKKNTKTEDVRGLIQDVYKEFPEMKPKLKLGQIDGEMVAKAREFPIDQLIKNRNNWAVCPFHNDKNPSLYIKNNFYHCFSCQSTGDPIDLVMKLYNTDFKTAVRTLAT